MIDSCTFQKLFNLLYMNMQAIIPVDGEQSSIYSDWKDTWERRMLEEDIRCIIEQKDDVLQGFLLYCIDQHSGVISIDEFQIHPHFQRNGVTFRRIILSFLKDIESSSCTFVRAYANKKNPFSPNLARKLKFSIYEETETGWRFQIKRLQLLNRLEGIKNRMDEHTPLI